MKRISSILGRKTVFLLVLMLLLCAMAGCSNSKEQENTKAEKLSLKEQGLKVVRLMNEKIQSDEYQALMGLTTSSLAKSEVLKKLREANYDQPENIYRIRFSNDDLGNLLKYYRLEEIELSSMSDELQKTLQKRILGSVFNFLITKEGVERVALQSYFSTDLLFVADEKNIQEIYLYAYPDQYPIAVTITVAEDGAASATGNFVILDDFKAGSEQEVKESLLSKLGDDTEVVENVLGIQIDQVK